MRKAVNTLDELSKEDYAIAEKAILKFRKTNKARAHQDVLYESLTNAGITPEGADEFINLEVEN